MKIVKKSMKSIFIMFYVGVHIQIQTSLLLDLSVNLLVAKIFEKVSNVKIRRNAEKYNKIELMFYAKL